MDQLLMHITSHGPPIMLLGTPRHYGGDRTVDRTVERSVDRPFGRPNGRPFGRPNGPHLQDTVLGPPATATTTVPQITELDGRAN